MFYKIKGSGRRFVDRRMEEATAWNRLATRPGRPAARRGRAGT